MSAGWLGQRGSRGSGTCAELGGGRGASGGGGGRAVTRGEDGGTGAAADCLDWLVAALS